MAQPIQPPPPKDKEDLDRSLVPDGGPTQHQPPKDKEPFDRSL